MIRISLKEKKATPNGELNKRYKGKSILKTKKILKPLNSKIKEKRRKKSIKKCLNKPFKL